MAAKKKEQKVDDYLVLGHLIKYNLYMLSKSIIFNGVLQKASSVDEAVKIANQVIEELDLDTKARKEQEKAKE